MSTTFDRLRDFLVKDHRLDPAQVTPETPLESLGIDSLGVADMLFQIEDILGIVLPQEPPGAMATVGDVAAYLDGLVAAQKGSAAEPSVSPAGPVVADASATAQPAPDATAGALRPAPFSHPEPG